MKTEVINYTIAVPSMRFNSNVCWL